MTDDRKDRRLCAEVRRLLSQWLSFEAPDELLQSLFVEAVEPAPDASCLLVTLSVPHGLETSRDAVLAALAAARGDLRAEISRVIRRRKTPDFNFLVIQAPAPDTGDEPEPGTEPEPEPPTPRG